MDIDNITEEEALDVLHKFRTKFGWAGTVFMKDDIIYRWEDKYGEEEGYALSDEQIEKVMVSWQWRKGMEESMIETGYEVMDMVLWEIKTGEEQ